MRTPTALYLQEQHDVKCGNRNVQYFTATFLAKPYSIDPTEGSAHDYKECEGCKNAKLNIEEQLKRKFVRFPFCCEWHQKLLKVNEFNKMDYANVPQITADKIIYCYQHIINSQDKDDWKQDITNYLEYAIESFGNFPEGYGVPLFIQDFMEHLIFRVEHNEDLKKEVKDYVISYINGFKKPISSENVNPFNLLISRYNVWLKLFPFDLPEFKHAKEYFEERTPLVIEEVSYNPYSKSSKGMLITENKLVDYLNSLTHKLLQKIDIANLQKNEELSQYYSIIIASDYEIESGRLFNLFSNNELKYIDFIKKWIDVQKNYFQQTKELFKLNNQLKGDMYNDSYHESLARIDHFKKFIEDKDGYILAWQQGKLREKDAQISFKAVWYNTSFDVNREVGNGRGIVDYTISKGANDKTLIEFKLASNNKMKSNLQHQLPTYAKANDTDKCISVILISTDNEERKVRKVLQELKLISSSNVITIDVRNSNKISASNI